MKGTINSDTWMKTMLKNLKGTINSDTWMKTIEQPCQQLCLRLKGTISDSTQKLSTIKNLGVLDYVT